MTGNQRRISTVAQLLAILILLQPTLFGQTTAATGAIEKNHSFKNWRSYKLKLPHGDTYRAATIGTGGLTLVLDHKPGNRCSPESVMLVTRLKSTYRKSVREAVPVSLKIDKGKVHMLTGVFSGDAGAKLGFLKIPATEFDPALLKHIHNGLSMRTRFRLPQRPRAYAGKFSLAGSARNMQRAKALCTGEHPAAMRPPLMKPEHKRKNPMAQPYALNRWRPLPTLVPDSQKYNPRKFDIAVFQISKTIYERCLDTHPYRLDSCILKRCSEYGPLRAACIKTIYMNTGRSQAPVPPRKRVRPEKPVPDPLIETMLFREASFPGTKDLSGFHS